MLRLKRKIHPGVLAGLDPAIRGLSARALPASVAARNESGHGQTIDVALGFKPEH